MISDGVKWKTFPDCHRNYDFNLQVKFWLSHNFFVIEICGRKVTLPGLCSPKTPSRFTGPWIFKGKIHTPRQGEMYMLSKRCWYCLQSVTGQTWRWISIFFTVLLFDIASSVYFERTEFLILSVMLDCRQLALQLNWSTRFVLLMASPPCLLLNWTW